MSFTFTACVEERDVDVSFAVATGETVAVLGPNGAGKSTVLAVSAGLLRPDRGRVVLGDRVLTDVGPADDRAGDRAGRVVDVAPHQRGIALLAQDPLLFPHLTALENVAFGPRSSGVGRREARERAASWLEQVDAADLAERRPGRLSGGQAQRVAIARALAAEPGLLLLDEPMAALDVAVTPALRQTLRRVLADRTAVIVTHDVLDALLLAARVVVVEAGRVVEDGPSAEVLTRPRSAFAARLAGVNLLRGRWRDDHLLLDDGTQVHGQVVGSAPASDDAVIAVFRPQAVAIYRTPVDGSPRNSFATVVGELEPLGDTIRVRARPGEGVALSADVTAPSVAQLDLAPGTPVTFSVKATEVSIYRT